MEHILNRLIGLGIKPNRSWVTTIYWCGMERLSNIWLTLVSMHNYKAGDTWDVQALPSGTLVFCSYQNIAKC
nr:hypothetical protein CFP56_66673 [Quercus suber]